MLSLNVRTVCLCVYVYTEKPRVGCIQGTKKEEKESLERSRPQHFKTIASPNGETLWDTFFYAVPGQLMAIFKPDLPFFSSRTKSKCVLFRFQRITLLTDRQMGKDPRPFF